MKKNLSIKKQNHKTQFTCILTTNVKIWPLTRSLV